MTTSAAILKLLDVIALGARLAPDVMAQYQSLSRAIGVMVAEGRDPTPDEWAMLDAETEALLEKILSA